MEAVVGFNLTAWRLSVFAARAGASLLVCLLYARLNQIKRDGFANVQAQTRAIAKDFRSRIGKYPFHIVSDSLSYAVTPLSPNNPEVSAHQLFLTLKDEYGIIICPNGGELADKVFRVGHIGHLTVEDNDALFRAFDDLMARGILKA